MEAESVEDNSIEFCVFCYNVQNGIEIDYQTGASRLVTDESGKTEIANCKITISPEKYTYTGSALKPTVQVYDNSVLLDASDYTVSYQNNVNAGTADVIITGKGNYTGTVTKHFTINPRSISATKTSVGNVAYTGKALKPSVTITYNNKSLVLGQDVTVTYKNNVNLGTANVILTGKGNFTGSKTITFTIGLAKGKITKVTAGSKKLNVYWSKVKGAKGYQLQYRLGNGKYKTVKITNVNTAKKTISNLKKKKSYIVRIRAYGKDGTKTVYGAYSSLVTKKTK